MRGEQYLTRTEDYGLVYTRGRSWANRLLVVKAMPNGREISRYGLSVSKRVGKAVVRNRVRRVLREVLRLQPLRPGWDIILIARAPAARAGYAVLREAAGNLLGRAGIIAEQREGTGTGLN